MAIEKGTRTIMLSNAGVY